MKNKKLILAVNTGSSSIKIGLYDQSLNLVSKKSVGDIGYETSFFVGDDGLEQVLENPIQDHAQGIEYLLGKFANLDLGQDLLAVGHRVVFSLGDNVTREIDDDLLRKFDDEASFDDDHMPFILKIIREMRRKFSNAKHIACFDSEFFNDLPAQAQTLDLPEEFRNQGIRKKGFHGLSYEYLISQLPDYKSNKRVVIAHLGSGCSLSAIKDGKPQDTTMVFTPNSGVVMSTRSGDLDPSIVKFIAEKDNLDLEQVDEILNKSSGLKAISGGETDVQRLVAGYDSNPKFKLAVDVFCKEIGEQIAAMASVLGGIDLLIFSGGIGQKSSFVRHKICEKLAFIGVVLNEDLNRKSSEIISESDKVEIRVMATDEEFMIASKVKSLTKV